MTGFVGFAPVYLNGLLAIYVAFFLPGMVLVRVLDIPGFPQRWLAVVLSSLAANHLLVTLIAALHLDPLLAYRLVVTALVAALLFIIAMKRARSGASILLLSDVKWLLGTLIVLGFTYSNVWKHGVPNIFQGSDVSVSWNAWSLIWSHGLFPIHSYGYPQFIPTIWAITYIFTGSTEQYFAYYTYIVFIVLPLVLCAAVLARGGWLTSLIPMIVFVWFIAEIREPWLRFCRQVFRTGSPRPSAFAAPSCLSPTLPKEDWTGRRLSTPFWRCAWCRSRQRPSHCADCLRSRYWPPYAQMLQSTLSRANATG